MSDAASNHIPPGLADLPLDARRAIETEVDREIQDGLTNRHLALSAEERAFAAANFATLKRVAPALAAKLRGG